MIERLRGVIEFSAVRIGQADAGAGTASVDDEVLTLSVMVRDEEQPLRLRLATIDSIQRSGDELLLGLRDGTRITMVSASGAALEDELVGRTRALPELTRTLRAFGSRRGRRGVRESHAGEQQ